MITYIILAIVLAFGRALDLISTWHLTPKFQLELNQWMKKVGWRNTILINIGLILIFPLIFNEQQVVMFAVISALMAFRNYQFLPMVKSLGENGYSERLKDYYGNARRFDFWVPATIKFLVIFLIGLFVITSKAVDKNNQVWFVHSIGQGLVFFAFFFFIIEIWTRKALLKMNEAA